MKSITVTIVVVLLLLCGCGDSNEADHDKNEALDTNSKSEILGNHYSIAKAPHEAPLLRWDFSDQNHHEYQVETTLIQVLESNDPTFPEYLDGSTTQQTATGNLLIESQGDSTARLVLTNMVTETYTSFGQEDQQGPTTEAQVPSEMQGLQEDGTMQMYDVQDMPITLLLPLPTGPFHVGESVSLSAMIPITIVGRTLFVNGTITVTLVEYVDIDGQICAHLNGSIDVADIQIPDDSKGTYKCSIIGVSDCIFSLNDHRLLTGYVDFNLSFYLNAPSSVMGLSDYEVPVPDKMILKIDSHETILVQTTE